jgi:hypothetical protein
MAGKELFLVDSPPSFLPFPFATLLQFYRSGERAGIECMYMKV